MDKKISIIVPVYNVVQYLRRQVDSILSQTYKNIELICVDDGSTDGSDAVLDSYGDKIKVIRQENRGAGVARNVGLEAATGEYVYFCDPDDWCEPNLLELCEKKATSENCDVVVFGRNIYDEHLGRIVERKLLPNQVVALPSHFSPKDISGAIFSVFGQAPWNKFYRRQFLCDKNLRFQALPRNNDIYFTSASYALAERIGVVNKALYNYRKNRPNGLQDGNDRTPWTLFEVFSALEKTLSEHSVLGEFGEAYNKLKIGTHLSKLSLLRSCDNAIKYVRELQRDELFRVDGEYYLNRHAFVPTNILPTYECVCRLEGEIVVSLTSFPMRICTVHQTIESILCQTIKPTRVILWLADSQFPNREGDLPEQLLALKTFGLEIQWCDDLRSYKKLLPTLKLCADSIIVTVDDDAIYSNRMLEKLYRAHLDYPDDVICHKASKLLLHVDGKFRVIGGGAHYFKGASALNKLVGVAGVLYPRNCFKTEITNSALALRLAPTNDDQWFWVHAVLSGRRVRVADKCEPSPSQIEGSQRVSLCAINDAGENLFWKDFSSLCGYYPSFEKALRNEWEDRAGEHNANMQVYREQLEGWYLRSARAVLHLDEPRSYNQKMQWLKLFDSTPIKTRLADKYLVREWVKERIGEKYLIPLLGVYKRFDEIDFDSLPDQFVIKGNHGCAYNLIVKDKKSLNLDEAKETVDKWMRSNFGIRAAMELHYRDIEPRVIVEQFIENKSSGGDLYDYKFWCFNGKVEYIQFLSERNLGGLKMAFYSRDWVKQPFVYSHPLDDKNIPRPDNLEEMIGLAEVLAKDFGHVRVDFYRLDDGTVYFGEMTFTSASGVCHWNVPGINDKFGELLKLPKLAYNIDTGVYFDPKETRPGIIFLEERCKAAWRLESQYKMQLKRVADRDEWLANEKQKVADRDKWLANEKKKVADRDKWLANEKKKVADRDKWLADVKRRLVESDVKLKKSKDRIKWCEGEICSLKESTAYRVGMFVTWPLRKLYRGICKRGN